ELVLRQLFPVPEVVPFNRVAYTRLRLFGLDEAVKQGMANVRLRWQSEPDGFAFDHTLNLYGFRSPHFTIDPLAGPRRVLLVGDSFVEGCGAADDDTIAAQFHKELDQAPVEAINLGIAGNALLDSSRLIRDVLPLLKPEALFLILEPKNVHAPDMPA